MITDTITFAESAAGAEKCAAPNAPKLLVIVQAGAVTQTDTEAVQQAVEGAMQQSDGNYKAEVPTDLHRLNVQRLTALSGSQRAMTTFVFSLQDHHLSPP